MCTKCVCHSCNWASFVGVVLYLQDELGLDALGAVDALHRGVGAAVLDGSPLKGDLPLEHGHHEVTVQEGVGLAVRQSWEDTRKEKWLRKHQEKQRSKYLLGKWQEVKKILCERLKRS